MFNDDEPRSKTPVLAIAAAIIFGAGSLWAGLQGIQLAFGDFATPTTLSTTNNLPTNTASVFDTVSKFIKNVTSSIQIPVRSTTVLIGGDIMFDRKIRSIGEKNGYDSLLTSLAPLFKTADVVVANLEGPITSKASKTLLPDGSTTANLTFTFAPATAAALSNANITAVSLANNHSYNFGVEGLKETKQWLEKSNIQSFGNPWNTPSTELVVDIKGMSIAFVGYHAFEPGIDNILADIKRLSAQGNFVIVMPHWGEEYAAQPTEKMRSLAKAFVAAGAKAVIGSHPHVIMGEETVSGVPVYYSIGNLLFDQYFSTAVMNGQILSLKIIHGPAGPSLDNIQVYETQLDKKRGVILK